MISLLPTSFSEENAREWTEWTLAPAEVRGMEVRAGCVVHVRSGVVWLTQGEEGVDHLLGCGDVLSIPQRGRAVLQALRGPAVVSIR